MGAGQGAEQSLRGDRRRDCEGSPRVGADSTRSAREAVGREVEEMRPGGRSLTASRQAIASPRCFVTTSRHPKVERPELFEDTASRRPIRIHDLRATFVPPLAAGRSEVWVSSRVGLRVARGCARGPWRILREARASAWMRARARSRSGSYKLPSLVVQCSV